MLKPSAGRWQRPLLQACQSFQRPCIDYPSLSLPLLQHRTLLTRPQINHEALFRERGIPGFLSREGFDISWTQYQAYIVEQLNDRIAGTPDSNSPPRNLLLKHSRSPASAAIFNYASMADNNHLFFSTLSPDPTSPSPFLLSRIEHSFSTMEALRETFLATAGAMFGPGFTWLVKKNTDDTLAILNTYIAGSPWPAAHYRKQPVDMNTLPGYPDGHPNQQKGGYSQLNQQQQQHNNAAWRSALAGLGGAGGGYGSSGGSFSLEVLFGVNTWEHVWLRDYGVHGKEQFLGRWWDKIDWYAAERNAGFKAGRRR